MGFNKNDSTKEIKMNAKAAAIERERKSLKCACGFRTFQSDGVCVICKKFGFVSNREHTPTLLLLEGNKAAA